MNNIKQYLIDELYHRDIDPVFKIYIDRYIKLINHLFNYSYSDNTKYEYHHIVPKSWNKSLINDPNNLIKVSTKAHVVLHHVLALTRDRKMTSAFLLIISSKSINEFNYVVGLKLVEKARVLNNRPFVNLNTHQEFHTVTDAMKTLGLPICQTRKIKNRTKIGGYFWQYKDVVEKTSIEYELKLCEEKERERELLRYKRIVIDLQTQQEYKSTSDIAKQFNLSSGGGVAVCIKNRMRVCNHYFQYKHIIDKTSIDYELKLCEDKYKKKIQDRCRPIRNLTTGVLYESQSQACRELGISSFTNPSRRLRVQGCYWQFEDIVQQTSIEHELMLCEQQNALMRRPVVNLITHQEYSSLKEALKAVGIKSQSMSNCIKNRTKCGGYFWQYKDVVEKTSIEYELKLCQEKYDNIPNKPRALVNLTTKEIFEKINHAKKKYPNVCDSEIKQRHRINGCYFQYKDIVDQTSIEYELKLCEEKFKSNTKERPVVNLITKQEFSSGTEASKWILQNTNLKYATGISDYIKKRQKFGGYYFQYKDIVDHTSIEYELKLCEDKHNANLQRLHNQAKQIRNLTTKELYESIEQAKQKLGVVSLGNSIKIRSKIKGCYLQYEDIVQQTSIEYELQLCIQNAENQRKKSYRAVVNMDTHQEFESVRAAKDWLGKNVNIISAIKLGTRCGGYYWQYKDVLESQNLIPTE